MDRKPQPAPFPVGARIRYVGSMRQYADPSLTTLTFGPGMEFDVVEVYPGRRGTLRQAHDEDGPMTCEDTGEPVLDTTRNGHSVYVTAGGARRRVDGTMLDVWERVS